MASGTVLGYAQAAQGPFLRMLWEAGVRILLMKHMIVAACVTLAGLSMDAADAFNEAPSKYWNADELMAAPAYKPAGFPDSEADGLKAVLFDGLPVNGKKCPVFAYIGYPEGKAPAGGFPAMVQVHGGGGTAYQEYARRWMKNGYAVIALDWYNQRPACAVKDGKAQTVQLPLEGGRRQDHVTNVGNIVLAHSLLRTLPNVNPDKIGLIGISWGSWYGAMVTAVDSRFKFMLAVYCGGINKESEAFINGRFLHAAKVPMCWIAGSNDQNVTLAQIDAACKTTPTYANRAFVIRLPHSHVGYDFPFCFRVAGFYLKGEPPLPKLGDSTVKDGIIRAGVLEKGKGIRTCILGYTTDRDVTPWHKRVWRSQPAELKDGVVSAKLPAGVFQCFLSAYDQDSPYNCCCGSSDFREFP